jgi:hypothetical protein
MYDSGRCHSDEVHANGMHLLLQQLMMLQKELQQNSQYFFALLNDCFNISSTPFLLKINKLI